MYHYVNAVTNTKGDALIGYYVKAVDAVTGNTASLYADANSTPIVSVSGVANAAKVDSDGNASFYIAGGEYHLDIYATDASTFVRRISNVPMVDFTVAAGNVASRAILAAKSATNGDVYQLMESGREGLFEFISPADYLARYGIALTTAVAADTRQGVHVAPASDTTGASGAWVRTDNRLTPFMFGAATNFATGNRSTMSPPYGESQTPGAIDGVLVDSRAACQAMIDVMALAINRRFIGDFSGGIWGIAKRADAGAHDLDGLVIDQPGEYPRRWIGGEFRGIGSGRILIYVESAAYSHFDGIWHIRSGADLGSSYGYGVRTWENGIWGRSLAESRWGPVKLSGFQRWAIELDPQNDPVDNNNIGARFERIYANNCGSKVGDGTNGFSIGWTASSRTGASGSDAQRTVWTLAAGHEILRVGDIVRAPNGQYHTIMSKAGADISVFPWNLSTAATGTLSSAHGGAIRATGPNVAGVGADHVSAVTCGAAIDVSNSLHGTEWGNVIQEGGGLGLIVGTVNGTNQGHSVVHMHSENNALDLLSLWGAGSELLIGACSAWAAQNYYDPFALCEVLAPNDGSTLPATYGLPSIAIFCNGEWITTGTVPESNGTLPTKSRILGGFSTYFSNTPGNNILRGVQAAGTAITTVLKYREKSDRFRKGGFVAFLEVVGAGGVAPTDSITVTLDATDVAAGIQFANGTTASTYVIAGGAATGPVKLAFWLDTSGATLRWIVVPIQGVRIGYGTGVGGTVTQATNKTTAVTLDKYCGQFTTNNAALASAALATFQVNDARVVATDTIILNLQSGQATNATYRYWIEKVNAGSFLVTIENRSGGSLSEALVFNFALIKAVNA